MTYVNMCWILSQRAGVTVLKKILYVRSVCFNISFRNSELKGAVIQLKELLQMNGDVSCGYTRLFSKKA